MFYRKKISFILLILFFSYYAFAALQSEKSPELNRRIDSLENEYNIHLKQSREDTATINILKKLSKIYFNKNPLKALDYYHKALKIAYKIDNKSEIASLHYHIGQVYREQGIYDLSIESFSKSLKINKELQEKGAAGWCYIDIGNVYYSMEIYKTSWKYYKKAINIFKESNNNGGLAVPYNNLALICIRKNNNDSALLYFNKALKIREKQNNKYLIAHSYNYIARIYKNTGQYEKALDIYNNAYNLYNEINNKSGVSEVLTSIGSVYEKQNKYKQAIQKYKQSLFIYEETGDNLGIAFSYYKIAFTYYLQNIYRQTIEYSTKSLNIALKNGLLIEEKDSYNLLYQAYLSSGNYKQAFNYLNKYFTIKDSIYSENVIKKINNQEFRIEVEKKEKEIELLIKDKALNESEIKKQKIVKYSFIIGFVLILIIVFIIYNRYKLKKKANEQLAGRNVEITKQKEEISMQRDQISLQKKEITDSIIYTKRIQQAILHPQEYLNKDILEHFILFKPRDILSGDFYWITAHPPVPSQREGEKNNPPPGPPKKGEGKRDGKVLPFGEDLGGASIIIAAVDCTGHGVPGAFMSMLGISFLNEIVSKHTPAHAHSNAPPQHTPANTQSNPPPLIEGIEGNNEKSPLKKGGALAGGLQGDVLQANEILNQLRKQVMNSLHQTGKYGETNDGMDIALCILNMETNELQYAGANNPLYIIRNNEKSPSSMQSAVSNEKEVGSWQLAVGNKEEVSSQQSRKDGISAPLQSAIGNRQGNVETRHASSLHSLSLSANHTHNLSGFGEPDSVSNEKHILYEVKADRMPIGIQIEKNIENLPSFSNNEIKLTKGDTLYIFSDGYTDQFGGKNGKKFKSRQFKELLISIQHKTMPEQKEILDKTIKEWKGNLEQVDDILVIGIRV